MRSGWTLPEMLISLCVTGVAMALASNASVGQLRFFRGIGEIAAVHSQLGDVGRIVAAALWGVSPRNGDIAFASDSAVEVRAPIGAAVACDSSVGRITVPEPDATGPTLSGWSSPIQPGDGVEILVRDSIASGWIHATVAAIEPATNCARFQRANALTVVLREPFAVAIGASIQFTRPIRFSHYRASDGQWYFGVRDWNGATGRLNTIQPVAGPLDPHKSDPSLSGLVFTFLDGDGMELAGANVDRAVAVTLTVRAHSRRPTAVNGLARRGQPYADSLSTVVALRNAQ